MTNLAPSMVCPGAWFYQVRAPAKNVGPVKALEKKPPIALTQPGAVPVSMADLLLTQPG
ncbi:hypothetical protein [Psychromicrobium xiongbiense]|uniref:hypothetical protein n=1 Tax=Psychromicrobium xiongbiense TaxID=3051184 RepID=UPI00255724E5|nr:hypothetical protein [Psychromicrobium sp. YIM S02556]